MSCIEMAGGVRRPVPLRRTGDEFRLDLDALAAAFTDRTVAILFNTPHNPTGAVLDETELGAIAELAVRHDAVAIVDEVYEHLLYDGRRHVPIATLPGMADRTVSISSAAAYRAGSKLCSPACSGGEPERFRSLMSHITTLSRTWPVRGSRRTWPRSSSHATC